MALNVPCARVCFWTRHGVGAAQIWSLIKPELACVICIFYFAGSITLISFCIYLSLPRCGYRWFKDRHWHWREQYSWNWKLFDHSLLSHLQHVLETDSHSRPSQVSQGFFSHSAFFVAAVWYQKGHLLTWSWQSHYNSGLVLNMVKLMFDCNCSFWIRVPFFLDKGWWIQHARSRRMFRRCARDQVLRRAKDLQQVQQTLCPLRSLSQGLRLHWVYSWSLVLFIAGCFAQALCLATCGTCGGLDDSSFNLFCCSHSSLHWWGKVHMLLCKEMACGDLAAHGWPFGNRAGAKPAEAWNHSFFFLLRHWLPEVCLEVLVSSMRISLAFQACNVIWFFSFLARYFVMFGTMSCCQVCVQFCSNDARRLRMRRRSRTCWRSGLEPTTIAFLVTSKACAGINFPMTFW